MAMPKPFSIFRVLYLFCLITVHDMSLEDEQDPYILINLKSKRIPIEINWKSTGSCPPLPHDKVCEWIMSSSFKQNLAWISALPHNGIEFIRVHWLLSTISITRSINLTVSYNFACIDKFFQSLHRLNITPIFEIMGNPSNSFTDFEDKAQLMLWNELIFTLVTRYLKLFGLQYLKRWLFETWNEPKPIHFDSIKVTPQGFLNYYDATSDGLKRAHDQLKLVTPGGSCSRKFDLKNLCWLLLHHIHYGKSIFRGRNVVLPDLISIHEKGVFPNSSDVILNGEIVFLQNLDNYLPGFKEMKVINDEADPQVSWNVSRPWQADTSYAALIAKIVHDHLHSKDASVRKRVLLLSHDNAFLSYHPFPFTQRTLLARFQVNITSPSHVQFIRKPSYFVLGLLSLLGEYLVVKEDSLEFYDDGVDDDDDDVDDDNDDGSLNWITTVHDEEEDQCWFLSMMVMRFDKYQQSLTNVTMRLKHLTINKYSGLRFMIHYMDDMVSNPYRVWNESGHPQTPSRDVFRKMRENEEPQIKQGPSDWLQGSSGRITLEMAPISIGMIHICANTCGGPGQVVGVQVMNITYGEVLIFWSDSEIKTKCLSTYEVEHSEDGLNFVRINIKSTIFNSFLFEAWRPKCKCDGQRLQENTIGYYRIRAIDFWSNPGKYSNPYKYPP